MTAPHWPTTRELPLEPGRSALLVIDVQNYCAHRNGGEFAGLAPEAFEAKFGGFFEQFERVALPNLKRLIAACRGGHDLAGHGCADYSRSSGDAHTALDLAANEYSGRDR